MKKIELKTLSFSKLRLYLLCPRQYYYAYAEGIFQKETRAGIFGSYVHAVLEDYLKHLLKTGKDQDLEALYGLARKREKEYEGVPADGTLSFQEADIIFNRFASKKIDYRKIYAVEKHFRIPESADGSVSIDGRMDRIDREEKSDGKQFLHIIDYKTGTEQLTEEELKENMQMKFYVLAAWLLYRKVYSLFRFTLYYLCDNREVDFETEYDPRFEEEITGHIEAVSRDDKYEKNIAQHCYYCPALKLCQPDLSHLKK